VVLAICCYLREREEEGRESVGSERRGTESGDCGD
jgi:hypothetical protein